MATSRPVISIRQASLTTGAGVSCDADGWPPETVFREVITLEPTSPRTVGQACKQFMKQAQMGLKGEPMAFQLHILMEPYRGEKGGTRIIGMDVLIGSQAKSRTRVHTPS